MIIPPFNPFITSESHGHHGQGVVRGKHATSLIRSKVGQTRRRAFRDLSLLSDRIHKQVEVYKSLDIVAQSVSHDVMYYIAKNLFKKANIMLNKKCI